MAIDDPRSQLAHAKTAEHRKDLMIKPIPVLLKRGDGAILLRQISEPRLGENTNAGLRCDLGIALAPRAIPQREP
jgi:hypothetical protein